MKGKWMTILATAVIGTMAAVVHVRSQQQPAPLSIEEVKPGLYAILRPGGNTIAVRVTGEGVILVDDMTGQSYQQIVEQIQTVTDEPVRYIINTHHHGDHTGSNAPFIAEVGPEVVGHENARNHMVNARPDPQPGPPNVTFTDEMAVHLGNAEVQVHYFGRGHTDGDVVAYFPDLGVIATGDNFTVLPFIPYIDYASGGSALEKLDTIDNILELSFDTVLPGHGPIATRADLANSKDRLLTLYSRTTELIRQGVGRDQYLAQLKVDDLGWENTPDSIFARRAAGPFYDELTAAAR